MRTLIAMATGEVVFDIFEETDDAGLMRQVFLYLYFLVFFTSIQNIFVSIIMEGYDRCTIRKEIDNDDPFPNKSSVKPLRKRETLNISNKRPKELDSLSLNLEKAHSVDKSIEPLSAGTPTWTGEQESGKLNTLNTCKYIFYYLSNYIKIYQNYRDRKIQYKKKIFLVYNL